ncbi:MAG: DUF4832 domain-containing protein [Acidobacteriota bacterium]
MKAISMLVAHFTLISSLFAQNTTIVRPREINDVLVNPGMGITTFQRFNGQEIYPDLRWSEVGPEGAVADSSSPVDFPDTSVAYLRWFWYQLEPEQGHYKWEIIDSALAEARRHRQQLQLRVMPYDQKSPMPEWYRKSGARRANRDTDADGKIWSPDADDPLYFKLWSALVTELGRRYDGHPDLDSVDISTVGYWGEGWGPYLPSWSVQKALIDVYIEAFKGTPLLMNFDELRALAYGTEQGAGWRLDCWGDMGRPGRSFAHMLDSYPQGVARARIQDVWKRSPVSLESCGTPGSWYQWKFDLDYIFEQALRWHASTINIKSTAIPAEWRPKFDEFQKKIGYRFILRRFEYPAAVRAGHMAPISMWWFNAGVAPIYRDFLLVLQFGPEIVKTGANPRQWLPGDSVVDESVYISEALQPGRYPVRVAILDPRTGQPAVKLAIEGREPDGWYRVGEIEVK